MNNFDEDILNLRRLMAKFQTDEFRQMMLGNPTSFDREEFKIISDSLSYSILKMDKCLKHPYKPTDEGLDLFGRYCKLRCKINDYLEAL